MKALALLPLAACTSDLNKMGGEAGEVQNTTAVPAGWKPPGAELNLQKVKIKR